jgi:hypothetical protein
VSLVEQDFPRENHPEVFLSLRTIHQAQMNSLRQHGYRQDDARLLEITVQKGGVSVLADAYLVRGQLTQEEAEFAFGYGVLLQLMGDLQDLRQDLSSGHTTPFTLELALAPLDSAARRLRSFVPTALRIWNFSTGRPHQALETLIHENCKQLIIQTVALNPSFLSPTFLQDLESRSAFRFRFLRQREETLAARGRRVVAELRRRSDADSLCGAL